MLVLDSIPGGEYAYEHYFTEQELASMTKLVSFVNK